MVNFVEISTWLRHAGSWFQKTEDLDPQVSLGAEKNKFAFQGVLGGTVKTQGGGSKHSRCFFWTEIGILESTPWKHSDCWTKKSWSGLVQMLSKTGWFLGSLSFRWSICFSNMTLSSDRFFLDEAQRHRRWWKCLATWIQKGWKIYAARQNTWRTNLSPPQTGE